MSRQGGFTLVELLVVISIVGILAAVIFGNFGGARDSARNNAIKAELKETQLALEVYRAQTGRYPYAGTSTAACSDDAGAIHNSRNASGACRNNYPYIFGIVPSFIGALPVWEDSGNSACSFEYQVEAGGGWYKLTAANCFQGATGAADGVQENTEFSRCPSTCGTCTTGNNYNPYNGTEPFWSSMAVYSVGGECE